MSRSVRTPARRPSASTTKTESPVPVALDRGEAVGEARARRDGHRLAAADDLEALVDEGGDARDDGALGQVGHAAKCIHFAVRTAGDGIGGRNARTARRRLLASGRGSPPSRRDRPHRRVRLRLRLGTVSSTADLRGRARLATAPRLAVRDRGDARLGVAARLAGRDGAGSGCSTDGQALAAVGLGVCTPATPGRITPVSRPCPASLAGVIVYIYPAIVAVSPLRSDAGWRAAARGSPSALALVGVVARASAASPERSPPPIGGARAHRRLAGHLRDLDRPLGAARRGATATTRPTRPADGADERPRPLP